MVDRYMETGDGAGGYFGDFYFDKNDEIFQMGLEDILGHDILDLYAAHSLYHKKISETKYVPVGSILGCTYGSILAKLSAEQVSGVYVGNGAPVTSCQDCRTGVNIPTFGTCTCPEVAGMPQRRTGNWGNAGGPSKEEYKLYGNKCVPMIDEEWKQPNGKTLIWNSASGDYSYALKDHAILVCRYGGVIGVVEVNTGGAMGASQEKVQIAPWLLGFKGKPTRANGKSINLRTNERNRLGEKNKLEKGVRGIDWYSYEKVINPNADAQYKKAGKTLDAKRHPDYDGFVNNDERYWIAVGPEVAYPGYNAAYPEEKGTLNETHFKYGTEIDVTLQHVDDASDIVYIECVLGDVKGHTYPYGVFQSGDPYPYSSNANEDGSAHREGSYIEFLNAPIDENGDHINGSMSKYKVIDIKVYERNW